MPPLISIVIPAHNEEALLGGTLRALGRAAVGLGEDCEIVVVDDGSTDRTAELATALGARVVRVDVRHIAAARNAGARAALGDVLVFVDADTLVPPTVLAQAIAAIRDGAVGGGSTVRMTSGHAWWAEQMMAGASWFMRTARWAAGCFLFARRDAFQQAGGFDERYFASEEIHLSRALKRLGRFVIISDAVITSGRKADTFSFTETVWQFLKLLRPSALKRRDGLTFWYGERGQ